MNQDGYTLAETLVALVIVGLTVGGLVAGVDDIGRMQSRAGAALAEAQARNRLNRSLSRLLEAVGPFRSDDAKGLSGEIDRFSFACGKNACGGELTRKDGVMNLVLTGSDGASHTIAIGSGAFTFGYDDEAGESPGWPPADVQQPRILRAISIIKPRLGGDVAIATARVFAEQPGSCAFDAISRTCRREAER